MSAVASRGGVRTVTASSAGGRLRNDVKGEREAVKAADDDGDDDKHKQGKKSGGGGGAPPSLRLRFVSWNIDGLCEKFIEQRLRSALQEIAALAPKADVIMLQEVVPLHEGTLAAFAQSQGYHYTSAGPTGLPYYCAVLASKDSLPIESASLEMHDDTVMGRHMLVCRLACPALPTGCIQIITSHLESGADQSSRRVKQLQACVSKMAQAVAGKEPVFLASRGTATTGAFQPPCDISFLAGDLNLRDAEAHKSGIVASGTGAKEAFPGAGAANASRAVKDCWLEAGSDEAHRFTWDLSLNRNIVLPGGATPRLRFDRAYLMTRASLLGVGAGVGQKDKAADETGSSSSSSSSSGPSSKPAQDPWSVRSFTLIGKQAKSYSSSSSTSVSSSPMTMPMHPSDHFGLVVDLACKGVPPIKRPGKGNRDSKVDEDDLDVLLPQHIEGGSDALAASLKRQAAEAAAAAAGNGADAPAVIPSAGAVAAARLAFFKKGASASASASSAAVAADSRASTDEAEKAAEPPPAKRAKVGEGDTSDAKGKDVNNASKAPSHGAKAAAAEEAEVIVLDGDD